MMQDLDEMASAGIISWRYRDKVAGQRRLELVRRLWRGCADPWCGVCYGKGGQRGLIEEIRRIQPRIFSKKP